MNRNTEFTFIGAGTTIKGTLEANQLRIDGNFEGEIRCSNLLEIGKTGRITANIHAQDLEVSGKIFGSITCEKRVELLKGAAVVGDITAKDLIINRGAIFHGSSTMSDPTKIPQNTNGSSSEPEIEIEINDKPEKIKK